MTEKDWESWEELQMPLELLVPRPLVEFQPPVQGEQSLYQQSLTSLGDATGTFYRSIYLGLNWLKVSFRL